MPRHAAADGCNRLHLEGYRWKYKEHDWAAGPGVIVYETAASPRLTYAGKRYRKGGPEVIVLNSVSAEISSNLSNDDDDSVMATANWRSAAKAIFCNPLPAATALSPATSRRSAKRRAHRPARHLRSPLGNR